MRSRERILANLESIYREAYDRAKEAEDKDRMLDLDSSFQREQLILEVLLDVRDALSSIGEESTSESALKKLETLKKFTRLAR
ncbi:MAG: hypothetical protein JSW51_13650 [Gemmatimonadota bacterium]|nr:MAG: hypothetical protein JSW51_13650 [Gemmatimonadota bacterium]